ncbi:MAG: rubrerythrin family protein [Proteobacteria bacterium]|nr:rubrerythrin family protein [Pseudomonadota bacterium]MBU1388477.1 rubrerythrin family protein [Pseudomonadota bacterium]MBU1542699.1 rubrerythrin family protein [Pseudomonadota bacterium]MBU2430237.1 rubrerythrin family protein [Pseudomonadota bacterium]MBU2481326.1 rubrerythrin family protein [Pseudomonadota bacterium]
MIKFRESRTAVNLHTSFAAEAQARTRYDFFADKARDEGYIQIAKIFTETAGQEFEHALRFFKFFNGGELEIKWPFPTGVIKDTHANLLSAAALEKYVSQDMYARFAVIAQEEGFERAADTFNTIIVAETHHEKMYLELAKNIETDQVIHKSEEQVWRCLNCGYLHTGKSAPEKCPACVKPAGHFELLYENW